MRGIQFLFLFSLCCLLVQCEWSVGFSAQNISPRPDERCCLGGFGACPQCRDQTGVHDDIFARTMYLNLDGEEVVFVALDTVGMSNDFIDDAQNNVSDIIKDLDRVILSATHSHSSPDLAGLWGGVAKSYRAYVIDQIRVSVNKAKGGAVPATLKIAKTTFTMTNNRRGWDGTDYGVLALWGEALSDGEILGMVVNFGSHPTIVGSSNTLVSRDWVNGLIVGLEKTIGDGKAMFVNGAQGDVSASRDGLTGDSFDKALEYGEMLADVVLDAVSTPSNVSVVSDELYFSLSPFTQCVTNQVFLAAANTRVCMDYNFTNANGACGPHGVFDGFPPKLVATQLAYLRLGKEVQLAVLPGEACTRMTIDGIGAPGFANSTDSIKASMTAKYQGVWGLSTDFLGYFIPEDEWNKPKEDKNPDNSNYEEGVSLGGDQANVWIRDRVKGLINADSFEPSQ